MSDRGPGVTNYSPWPKDTRARCPQCRSAELLALGRVLADTTEMLRGVYRCRECGREFILPHNERRVGLRDRRVNPERRAGPERRVGERNRRANTQ